MPADLLADFIEITFSHVQSIHQLLLKRLENLQFLDHLIAGLVVVLLVLHALLHEGHHLHVQQVQFYHVTGVTGVLPKAALAYQDVLLAKALYSGAHKVHLLVVLLAGLAPHYLHALIKIKL